MPLDPEQESELTELLEAEKGPLGLDDYIRRVSPDLPPPPHLAQLRRLIERARTEEVRALISFPPGFAKSTTINHGLAWILGLDPANLNATASYGSDLANSNSRAVRRLALEAGALKEEPVITYLDPKIQTVSEWRTVEDGGLIATGVGGAITGRRVTGLFIIDDAIKGREAAESLLMRDKTWDWFRNDVYSRLTQGSSCIVCSTRWHEDDTHGRIMSGDLGEVWEEINLPAISDDTWITLPDGTASMKGEALWPDEYPVEKLVKIRKTVGEYAWSSLYMGSPRPKGDRVFLEPSLFWREDFIWSGHRGCNALDPAATESTRADYSALGTFAMKGYGEKAEMWVINIERHQIQIPKLCRHVAAYQKKNEWGKKLLIVVESIGGFKAVPQMLKDIDEKIRLHEIHPSSDKYIRAQPVAAAWNDGRVHVARCEWSEMFMKELMSFTGVGDKHDDMVDILAHAWNALYRESGTRRGSRKAVGAFG